MRTIVTALVLLSGCETGTEIAGVSQATIDRSTDGVVVTATLHCMVARGMGRADGNCDADDTRVCVTASWFETSEPKPDSRPIAEQQVCQTVEHIAGATIRLPFSKLPDTAHAALVSTTDQHRARGTYQRPVVATDRR